MANINSASESPAIGLLFVGHGTRDLAGRAEFLKLAECAAARSTLKTAACFLELAEPNIDEGVAMLAEQGVRRIVIVPVLLFSAGHAKEDVPSAVRRAAEARGCSIIGQSEPLQCHPALLRLSRLRWDEVGPPRSAHPTLFIVGRGGSDPSAIREMHRYAELHGASLGVPTETAFVAIARPSFEEKLAEIAARKPAGVIVQPHLLFQGELNTSLERRVREMNVSHPETIWHITAPLGPHELVAEALLDLASRASSA